MPILTNAKHERFAQELAKGRPAVQAHKAAGFDGNSGNASRLQRRDSIVQRVAEIMDNRHKAEAKAVEEAADELRIDTKWLMQAANEARELAISLKQPAAAVSAIKELGILSGHRVEKRENTNRTLSEMTDDELLAIARGGGERAPSTASGSALTH